MNNGNAYQGSCFCGAVQLTKMKDIPKEMGGTGISLAE